MQKLTKSEKVEKALKELVQKGANIKQIETDKFMVVDNGFFNFCGDEDPFIIDGDGVLEIYEDYISY